VSARRLGAAQIGRTRGGAVLLACALGPMACSGGEPMDSGTSGILGDDDGSSSDEGPAQPDPEPEPDGEQTVPRDVTPLELQAYCFDVDGLPTQLSVAPEGALWLREDDQAWRVIDPFGNDERQQLPAGVAELQAWSEDQAFVIIDGELWDVQGQWPQPLAWPEIPEPTAMCGDPSSDANGFVVADGLMHRDAGQWWEWSRPSGEPWADVAWMARNAGTCVGPSGELWLADADGEVWRIEGDFAARVEDLDGATRAVLVDGLGAAAIVGDDVVAGDLGDFTRYRFEAGPVSALSSGGDVLWVMAGGTLHRYADGQFTAAMLEGQPVQAGFLHAEAGGGVWALTPGQACHLRPNPPVRVEGVHNLQRLGHDSVEIAVRLYPGTSLASAALDGEDLSMEPDGPGRFRAPARAVDEGWHTLEVFSSGSGGAHARRVRFEQRRVGDLTWSRDVQPVFQEHCSGAACHGPDIGDANRPDLSTWDAWAEREEAILDRVVVKGDMPPANVRKDTWGLELQLLVSEWFETGAAQGED